MAFLRPVTGLLPKLSSITHFTPLTHKKVSSFPSLSSSFGVNLSNFGNFLQQKRGLHIRVLDDGSEEEDDDQSSAKVRDKDLDDPDFGDAFDCLLRNSIRFFFTSRIQVYGSLESLLGKNLAWLQLVLIDANRFIEKKIYKHGPTMIPDDPNFAEQSRCNFKVIAPCLLQNTEHWVFSRSLVLEDYNGLINEALKFTSHDPVGGLKDVPFDLPLGTDNTEVSRYCSSLCLATARAFKHKSIFMPMPLAIRCTEVFLFIAGDFSVEDWGLNTREAVQKLLNVLNTAEGMTKIHVFDVVCGTARVSPEHLAIIKDMHLTA